MNNNQTTNEYEFSDRDRQRAMACIAEAQSALGPLTRGQKRDLLIDNLTWLVRNSDEAERLLAQLEAN